MNTHSVKKILLLCEEFPLDDYLEFSKKFSQAFYPETKLALYYGINNFSPRMESMKFSFANLEIITIPLNGQSKSIHGNFRREAINEFFKSRLEVGDPFAKEDKSILWTTAILYFEKFAIFRRNVAIASSLAKTSFDSIIQLDKNMSLSILEQPWFSEESNQSTNSSRTSPNSESRKRLDFILKFSFLRDRIKPLSVKRYLKFLKRILLFCLDRFSAGIKLSVRVSKFTMLRLKRSAKLITKKFLKIFLLSISKWSIKQASKAKFVIICDFASIKKDPLNLENEFFIDYFPDIATYYSETGATRTIALRPTSRIGTVYKLLRNGYLPVWPTLEKIPYADKSRIRSSTKHFAAQTFQKYGFLLAETLLEDVELYYPEHDFTIRHFKPFVKSNSQIILLMWEGRNRAIATGLNHLGLNFHAFQSALGSYDLSHAGLESLGVRTSENKNGVPIPERYFLWRQIDKLIMGKLKYQETDLDIVGSLRISNIRNATKEDASDFYNHLFGKKYERCFVWAPVLTALETPTLFEESHSDLFEIFFKKLNSDDCVVIKPWPGADINEFAILAERYPRVVLWNPKAGWTNATLLQNSFGLISTFSSFIFEAIANGARVMMIDFPETKMYFNFETYRELANTLPSVSTREDLTNFSLLSWNHVDFPKESNAQFDLQSFRERIDG